MVNEEDQSSLRKEAAYIDEIEESSLEQSIYQNLYYMAFFEVWADSKDKLENDKLFLSVADIQEQQIKTALIDIGLVSTQDEEFLHQLRTDVVRLIRGKKETEDEFFECVDDFDELRKTMNNIDASACRVVFSLAQKEAFNGSMTFPLED